jgi:UDP-N-acetylmuramoylalanine--D-glutamate ligase|tara:strand:+ start:842 stop:2131 length:1290 start_codon:yes stop_codon:yes gene_type:complete
MKISKPIKDSSYAIYGLGLSGKSVFKFLKKKNIKKIYTWDDKKNKNDKKKFKLFKKILDIVDYIVISPGINIQKTKFKSRLLINKKKLITDLDLFYMQKIPVKSIVITGTNGKSTACKLTQHIFKASKLDAQLGGNIGKPILDLKIKKKSIVIIEASSFQLSYTKFIKPTIGAILNISSDHLDWHNTITNYKNSKFKIFSKQDSNDIALLNNKKLVKLFKKNNYLSELKIIRRDPFKNTIGKKITNDYLISEPNLENLALAYQISKLFKIKEKTFLKAVNNFKGLPHRHEIFLKKKKITFINDSKATSFDSTKHALKNNKNIFWIFGGLPKIRDNFNLLGVSSNIIKSFIIGKKTTYFKNQIGEKIKYKISFNLKNAIKDVFKELCLMRHSKITVLFSPASASYDQFNNFAERGNQFKKITKDYVKKFL